MRVAASTKARRRRHSRSVSSRDQEDGHFYARLTGAGHGRPHGARRRPRHHRRSRWPHPTISGACLMLPSGERPRGGSVRFREGVALFRDTIESFSEDKASRLGAALAYYTVFSIPPLLLLLIGVG